jgi:hypothetical protein
MVTPTRTYPVRLTEHQWVIVCEALRNSSSSLTAVKKAARTRTAKAKIQAHSDEFEGVRDFVVAMLRAKKLAKDVPLEF